MRYQCSACQRLFDQPGFCPFDGTPLQSITDKPTVVSAFVPAQSDAETIQHRPTEPGVGPEHPRPISEVRAVSASDSPDAALDMLRGRQAGYDYLIGQTLDRRYIVERKIGEGGMGVVFAVRHNVIERPLAIKVLKREVMRDAATISRFKREAQAASRIGHPNIVDVTDFGETPDGMTYSVMEYVDGTTLAQAIRHAAPMPPERAIHIASQIARALHAAHEKGIVHRDLKPENVFLVDREGRPDFVKIVDFGIAKIQPVETANAPLAPRLTRAGAVFGTPEYMAPEQAAGRNDTDRRVDIYALGTILYEMLVGKVPHKGRSMMATIAMQMLDPVTPPSRVHPDLAIAPALEAVVMKALAKQRDDRYQTMAELLAALGAVGDAVTAQPTLSLPPLPPGADPGITPSPAAQITTVAGKPVVAERSEAMAGGGPAGFAGGAGGNASRGIERPRRAKPQTRPLHEPEFVAAGARSFDHVFEPTPVAPTRRRWPLLALALAVIGGGALVAVALRADHDDEQPVAQVARDAASADAPAARDAAIIAEPTRDAAPPTDALIAIAPGDAGRGHRRDAGAVAPPVDPASVTIQVYARPGEATIYVDGNYAGVGMVNVSRPWGTHVKIECKTASGRGTTDFVFDGKHSNTACAVARHGLCVPDLHNPIDKCKEDGSAEGPVTHPTP